MKPQAGTWGEVKVGSYVLDQAGKAWKVAEIPVDWDSKPYGVRLVDRDGGRAEVPWPGVGRPVTLLVPEPGLEVAIAVLGAKVICEPFAPEGTRDLMSARAHLRNFHGIHPDGITKAADAHEAHDWATQTGKITTPHIHQESA